MRLQHVRCRCCGVKLTSGRIFYPSGSRFVCEFCKAPVLRSQEPVRVYVETDEFVGDVPVRYVERYDVT
ncbi:hypothetical protein M7775_05705 [Sporomusa sphaeroides DSM 2875]|uniref:hypothetical protein n=1 Tax=Sporomusa sphaeroides TaxID=47679 RepID=UPI002030AC8B|nr:hypothetical protein [Sporomusa sphaeroides]MCM0758071.1 hypothetical protein [Sporomusa sphaeroides DSM 2875]